MGFANRMEQNVTKYWYPNGKNGGGSRLFEMVGVVIQSVWVLHICKGKGDESLPLLAFRRHVVNVIVLKYLKEGRLSSSHLGIRNIPSGVCHDYRKYYQVQSEHRCIRNPFNDLRESVFV